MQIGTRFSVAIHILLFAESFKDKQKITSDTIAESVNTNPVVIRKIMGQLKKSNLIKIASGSQGIQLAKNADAISLLDVFHSVTPLKEDKLFKIHEDSDLECPVGGKISRLLEDNFGAIQNSMHASLRNITIESLLQDMKKLRKRGGDKK